MEDPTVQSRRRRRLWLKGLALLPLAAPGLAAGRRRLRLLREATGESLAIDYAVDGRHDPLAYLRLCRLCRDVRRDTLFPMDIRLLDLLWAVQRSLELAIGWEGQLVIHSGYRTEETNREVHGRAGSYHLRGQAVDWHAEGIDMAVLADWLATWGGVGGLGFYAGGGAERGWLHLDTGPARTWRG